METPQEKYWMDPNFKKFVNILREGLNEAYITPVTLREAVEVACFLYKADKRKET